MSDRAVYAEAITIGDLLVRSADRRPNHVALVVGEEQLSYEDLVDHAKAVARGLMRLGIEAGDHVGILMPNSVDFVAAFFGAAMAGAVIVPMNTRYRPDELRYVTEDADLRALLTNDAVRDHVDFYALLREAFPGLAEEADGSLAVEGARELRWVVNLGKTEEPGFVNRSTFLETPPGPGTGLSKRRASLRLRDLAALIYTSGTTSRPKGCMHTHEALVRDWLAAGHRLGITQADRCWDPLPMFHGTGYGPLMATLAVGGTFITDLYFDADRALDLIAANRPTFLYPGFPAVTGRLIDHPRFSNVAFDQVRALLAIAPLDFWHRSQAAFPHAVQLSGYGLAEAGGIVSYNRLTESKERRATTCGPPLPGFEVRVVDPETGEPLPAEARGEIQVRSPTLFLGYYKDPQKTSEVLTDDGFLRTGDLGSLDDRGCLVFAGRIKDMLKVGGENVAPAEIESCLLDHPGVAEVQVVGIPDWHLGEVAAAFVELRPGVEVAAEALIDHCRRRIASFKVPRLVRFVSEEEWPRSATKIQKSRLRERLLEDLARQGESREETS